MSIKAPNEVVQYVEGFQGLTTHSMFGGMGYFVDEAMFLLEYEGVSYLRGGGELSQTLKQKACQQFSFPKRISNAKVEYYNITEIYRDQFPEFKRLLARSISNAKADKAKSATAKRIRDLPNLQLSTERMLIRVGVDSVAALLGLGAAQAFIKLQDAYGLDLTINLLWKLEGAIQQVHYRLLDHEVKNQLLRDISPNRCNPY